MLPVTQNELINRLLSGVYKPRPVKSFNQLIFLVIPQDYCVFFCPPSLLTASMKTTQVEEGVNVDGNRRNRLKFVYLCFYPFQIM